MAVVAFTFEMREHWPKIIVLWPALFTFFFGAAYGLLTFALCVERTDRYLKAVRLSNTLADMKELHVIEIPPHTIVTSHT
jgi:hypothetical protein